MEFCVRFYSANFSLVNKTPGFLLELPQMSVTYHSCFCHIMGITVPQLMVMRLCNQMWVVMN